MDKLAVSVPGDDDDYHSKIYIKKNLKGKPPTHKIGWNKCSIQVVTTAASDGTLVVYSCIIPPRLDCFLQILDLAGSVFHIIEDVNVSVIRRHVFE
jgi:hypothetical protein